MTAPNADSVRAHDHDFGAGPPRPNRIVFCRVGDCTEARIGTPITRARRSAWRPLNTEEMIALIAHQTEAIAIAQAMTIIHGKDRGMRRAREVLGYPAQIDGSGAP